MKTNECSYKTKIVHYVNDIIEHRSDRSAPFIWNNDRLVKSELTRIYPVPIPSQPFRYHNHIQRHYMLLSEYQRRSYANIGNQLRPERTNSQEQLINLW